MKRIFLILTLFAMLFAFPALALEIKVDGVVVGGSFGTQLNFSGDVSGSGAGSQKNIVIGGVGGGVVEFITATEDTVVAADDNTIFVTTNFNGTDFTLPAAAAGLKYTFVAGHINSRVTVDTASASDTIQYLTLDAGDAVQSITKATGASVTLVGDNSNSWYVLNMTNGAWNDGGP